jgi:hypothetical protein
MFLMSDVVAPLEYGQWYAFEGTNSSYPHSRFPTREELFDAIRIGCGYSDRYQCYLFLSLPNAGRNILPTRARFEGAHQIGESATEWFAFGRLFLAQHEHSKLFPSPAFFLARLNMEKRTGKIIVGERSFFQAPAP